MTAAAAESSRWEDARLAAALFAVDPAGLAGLVVRGAAGPLRDRWLSGLRALLPPDTPFRRAPLHIDDDRLLGGLDLPASLAAGRPVAQSGLLAEANGGVVLLAMAERIEPAAAARLTSVLDTGEAVMERDGLSVRRPARIGLIALDEGNEPDERPPSALLERLAFRIDLDGLPSGSEPRDRPDAACIAEARLRLPTIPPAGAAIIEALCAVADRLGLASARPALLALGAARAHAALEGRGEIAAEDAAAAARLVLAPRALAPPERAQAEPPSEPEPPPPSEETPASRTLKPDAQTELVIAAIAAALPEDLFARIHEAQIGGGGGPRGRGVGPKARSARHGRAVGVRQGAFRPGDRLNLVETLRAAAPWQRLRGAPPGQPPLSVRRQDFRIRRLVQRTESTTIFVVDASGSTALQRLAETKGAVELLLARAYVSRNRVALIAFRGPGAELLLPPTRSLTRAKRRLAELPGGGGTPLAAGVEAALALGLAERAMKRAPTLVFLTDGKANIGLDGEAGRAAAEADALAAARRLRQFGLAAAWLDTSPRARPDGDRFANAMGAAYAPLPYVNAGAVADLVSEMSGGRR